MQVKLLRSYSRAPSPGVTNRYQPGLHRVPEDMPHEDAEAALGCGAAEEVKAQKVIETKAQPAKPAPKAILQPPKPKKG